LLGSWEIRQLVFGIQESQERQGIHGILWDYDGINGMLWDKVDQNLLTL